MVTTKRKEKEVRCNFFMMRSALNNWR